MADCEKDQPCDALPEVGPAPSAYRSVAGEQVRRYAITPDDCCEPLAASEAVEAGINTTICGQIVIENGRIKSWPVGATPVIELSSNDGSILVERDGCRANIEVAPRNANFECPDVIRVHNGRVLAIAKVLSTIEFAPETCLEVVGFNKRTGALVIGLRAGCTPPGAAVTAPPPTWTPTPDPGDGSGG